MNFKYNIRKLIGSILISIILGLALNIFIKYLEYQSTLWKIGTVPTFYEYLLTFNDLFSIFIPIIILFIIIYLIWSSFEKRGKK